MAVEADAVFFDAGQTLIYPDPPVGEMYARALRRVGIEADPTRMEPLFVEAWRRTREQFPGSLEYGRTEADAKDFWRRVVRASFEPFGWPEDFEETFLYLWEHFAEAAAWRVYDDVLPTFGALRQRGKGLGLISNWDVRLARLLGQLGLGAHLDWIVISCAVGVEKPDQAIFQLAVAECGLPPDRIVHVGDSLEEDAMGARQAGLHAVWLRREDGDSGAPPAGVVTVSSLTEIPDLVG
ncbi:MAG: HAD-IA family hydrolase [Planctomycetota bacterium]